MKIIYFWAVMVCVFFGIVSCSPRQPLCHDVNPKETKILTQLEKNLQSYNLQLIDHNRHFHLSLISGFRVVCWTHSPAFFDKQRAEAFMANVVQGMISTIEAPENRLYLAEFPVDRRCTTLILYFIDPRTGKPPIPPFYSRLVWDTNGKVDFYQDHQKVNI